MRVIVQGDTAAQAVEVVADPRFQITLADRRAKREAVMRLGQRQEVAVEAVERLRKARKGVDGVLQRVADDNDDGAADLRAAADSVKRRLDEVEDSFTGPRDIQGFTNDPDAVLTRLGRAMGQLSPSWDAPTETQLLMAQQAEARLERGLSDVNAVLAGPVAEFRRRVEAAGLELFPAIQPLTMEWKADGGGGSPR